jgi:dihydrofolate reductase
VDPDPEVHQFFTDLLDEGDIILYGRKTYQLMEDFWPLLVKAPSGQKSMDDFARSIGRIPKLVFSRTLSSLNWDSARLAAGSLEDELRELKARPGLKAFLGSPSMIVQATNLRIVDEYRLVVHPVIVGKGLPLMKDIANRMDLVLVRTRPFRSGAMELCYRIT